MCQWSCVRKRGRCTKRQLGEDADDGILIGHLVHAATIRNLKVESRDLRLLGEGLGMDSAFLQQLYPRTTSPFFTHPDINSFTCLLSYDIINSELYLNRSHFY